MDSRIATVRDWFNKIHIEGIPHLFTDQAAFLSFVCVLVATDELASFRYGSTTDLGRQFRGFVEAYFPQAYRPHDADLWKFRNGMIHAFCPRGYALIHNHSHLHLQPSEKGVQLNAQDFYEALRYAADKYFNELDKSPQLQATFVARLDDTEKRSGLSVGPLEQNKPVSGSSAEETLDAS